jgi:hypothetical protein
MEKKEKKNLIIKLRVTKNPKDGLHYVSLPACDV